MSFKLVFMGTPEFSIPTLEALIKNKFNIVSVYTQPPKNQKGDRKFIHQQQKIIVKKMELILEIPQV